MATNLSVNGHSKRLVVSETLKESMSQHYEDIRVLEPNVNENARKVLAARYLIKDQDGNVIETPGQLMRRVAKAIAGAEDDPVKQEYYSTVFELMLNKLEFLPNTPCLVNAGRPGGTGQYSACFVLPVPDSMEGIFEAVKQMALVHQTGGGTGFSFSRLRPKGDIVRTTSGVASGPISFMTPFNATTETTKQGGVRRGANMGVLRVDHPDILDFIRLKANDVNALQNFNVSVGITDAFMAALASDSDYALIHPNTQKSVKTLSAKYVFDEIVRCAHTIGDPGLIFLDRVNALDPLTDVLGPIEATNPCVPAGTKILTGGGWVNIESVVDQSVRVWNGEQWSLVRPQVTGHNQPIVKVTLSDGHTLRCTPRHAFYLADGTKIEARDLRVGDSLEKLGFTPATEGITRFANDEVAYLAGFYQGDGHLNTEKRQQEINFYGAEKINIAYRLPTELIHLQPYSPAQDRKRGTLKVEVPEKGFVPLDMNIKHALEWLAGLLDSDGNIVANGTTSYGYQISGISRPFLADVQLLLRRLGVPSTLALMKDAETKEMPGGEYECQPCWRITIAASATRRLQDAGLQTRRLKCDGNNPAREALRFPRVVSVEPDGVADTVYCFTEPMRHRGVFDGVLTGQCGEVPLRAHDACTLGSIDLSKFYTDLFKQQIDYDRLKQTVHLAVRFLDNVLTVNKYPVKEIYEVTGKSRKIGLGVMGWAELLIKMGIPYTSDEAYILADNVMSFISSEAILASEKLAEERGPFPVFEQSKHRINGKKPRRNSTATVIAPTGTISIIAGCSSGIEPLYALGMTRDQAGMKMIEINPLLEQVARQHGFWSEELKEHVAKTGSVQNAPGVPDKWKKVLLIANEIPVEAHIAHQAAFQAHVEDGVSKTINMAREATLDDVRNAYMQAWESGCKGITVYRDGCREGQVLTIGTKAAEAAPSPAVVAESSMPTYVRRRIPKSGRRKGETLTRPTTFGSIHVTLNEHPDDREPFEMFVRIGKGGSEVNAWTEAFGRAASYLLSIPSPIPPTERLAALADQLADIGGGEGVGFGEERTSSAADAIARIVRDFLAEKAVESPKSTVRRDLCPSCHQATLTFEQKCGLCTNCGFSKC